MSELFTVLDDWRPVETGDAQAHQLIGRAEAAGRPVALDDEERVAYLGVSARERARQLASLAAPDFALPGVDGQPHSLAAHRGKKVFLVAYASW
jgi:hypothetical protein